MIKRMDFSVIEQSAPIKYATLFPNNLARLRKKYPKLLSEENIKKACSRFGTKKGNLVVIELPYCANQHRRVPLTLSWVFKGEVYELTQVSAVLMDGASSPVCVGQIGNFNPNLLRGWYVHDAIYALFHKVKRLTADRIFACFNEADGTKRGARMVMMSALRMFGGIARKMKPQKHWNYGRMELKVNGVRIYE